MKQTAFWREKMESTPIGQARFNKCKVAFSVDSKTNVK